MKNIKEGEQKATIIEVEPLYTERITGYGIRWYKVKWKLNDGSVIFDNPIVGGNKIKKYEIFNKTEMSDLIGQEAIITVKKVHSEVFEWLTVTDIKKDEEK